MADAPKKCPWAKSDMTPCVVKDGEEIAAADDGACVGCGRRFASWAEVRRIRHSLGIDPLAAPSSESPGAPRMPEIRVNEGVRPDEAHLVQGGKIVATMTGIPAASLPARGERPDPNALVDSVCACGKEYSLPASWSNTTCDQCGRTIPGQWEPWTADDEERILEISSDGSHDSPDARLIRKLYYAFGRVSKEIEATKRDHAAEVSRLTSSLRDTKAIAHALIRAIDPTYVAPSEASALASTRAEDAPTP